MPDTLKTSIALLIALAAFLEVSSGNSTRSAQYYLNNPEKWEGKKIVLYTSHVTRQAALDNDFILFSAYTMSRDDDESAYISVLVPKAKADQFARRFGADMKFQNGDVKKMAMPGILRQKNDTWFLVFE